MKSYRVKLTIVIALLVIVSQLTTGFFITRQSEQALDEKHHDIAEAMARNIAFLSTRAFLSRDLATLYEHVRLARQEKNVVYVKIVDLEQRIVVSDTLSEVGQLSPVEVGSRDRGLSHYTTPDGEILANIIWPIMLDDEPLGYVILGYSHDELAAAIGELKKKIITTLVLGLSGSVLLAVFIAGRITAPLRELKHLARNIAAGRFDIDPPAGLAGDEFHVLACTLYDMARRLESLVYNDPLTGIYNRLLLNTRLREELARSRRHKCPLAVLIVDIDHFKRINDTYGHLVGDEVLVGCADILSHHIREEDCLARFGGEEFVILAPDITGDNAVQFAERIRVAVEKAPLSATGLDKPVHITVSIGIAIYPDHASDENELISRADAALYEAKSRGRNCTALFSKENNQSKGLGC
ncbi:diguanylate cyclase [Desulfolithobacter sp.]